MKQITLTLEQARSLYKKDPTMDELILANFSKKELEKKKLPKSWKELGIVSGYRIGIYGYILDSRKNVTTSNYSIPIFATGKQAKSALSIAQLSQLMKVYNDGWEADWDNDSNKYVIKRSCNELFTDWYESTYHFLAFKSAAIRDEFLKNFEPLIKEYFEL